VKFVNQKLSCVKVLWYIVRVCSNALSVAHCLRYITSGQNSLTKGHIAAANRRWSLYFTMERPFPFKIAPFLWGSGLPFNSWFLGPTRVHTQTASRSVQPFLHGSRQWQADQQTDHATQSVTIGRIYVVLRCGLTTHGTADSSDISIFQFTLRISQRVLLV